MDGARFDRLVAFLGTRASRRAAVGLLAALAPSGAPRAAGAAPARKKPKAKPCGPCKRRVRGKCKPKPAGTPCAGGACRGGVCAAAPASPPSPPPPPSACPPGQPECPLASGSTCCAPTPGLPVAAIACRVSGDTAACLCSVRLSDACAPGCPIQSALERDCADPTFALEIAELCDALGCQRPE